jgi:hypothetical protein
MLHEPHHSHANAERVRDRGDRHVAVRAKLHLECAGLMNGDIETVLRILQAEEPDDAAAALLMGRTRPLSSLTSSNPTASRSP